jgi:tRNA modification GTPase
MAKDSSNGWSSVLSGGADTIIARASGPGRGALCVIRLSGPDCSRVAAEVCDDLDFDAGWKAQLVALAGDEGGDPEKAIAIPYRRPRSYTGEDMLEVVVHGSPYVVEDVIDRAVAAGARRAEPGEFTRRAVANGKLDLVRAEAIRDLIAAETALQAHNARQQLGGELSEAFGELRAMLVGLLARLEAGLDFAAQDIVVDQREIEEIWRDCRGRIDTMLKTAETGERIRDGVRVAILGRPNAGKSTLFNSLLGRERAIVDPEPGTTRDVIESELDLDGVRVVLVDTAGLREAGDRVEREGVRRTRVAAASAHVVLQLWGKDEAAPPPDVAAEIPVVRVRSKVDLVESAFNGGSGDWLKVSAVTGEGLDALRSRLVDVVHDGVEDLGGGVAIAARHNRCLQDAASELERVDLSEPELAAEAVRWALHAVRELTGEVMTEQVLDEVFGTFCIGK